jgi:hypothetical protein
MKRSLLVASGIMLAGSGAFAQSIGFHDANHGYAFYGGYNVLYYGQGAYSDPGNNVWNGFGKYAGPGSTAFYGPGNPDSGHGAVPNGNPGNPYAWHNGTTASGANLFSPTSSGAGNVGNATSAGTLSSVTLSMTYGFDNGATGGMVQGSASWILSHAAVVNGNSPGAGTAANPMGVATLANVAPGTYNLFLYGANYNNDRGASFTVSSGTFLNGISTTINDALGGPANTFILGDNYVEAIGVTPDANGDITIDWGAVTNPNSGNFGEGDFNGLQLVLTPEPGTLAICGLGIAGLVLLRRRR